MFKVSNTVPGFRVGIADDEPGFRILGFDPPSVPYELSSPMALLAAHPYLRVGDNPPGMRGWEASGAAFTSPFESGLSPWPFGTQTRSAWALPHLVASGLQIPAPVATNVVPVGAPPTPCVGGECKKGGSYGNGGVIPHPRLPGQYLCPDCALKLFDLDIRDPDVRKMLDW